MIEWIKQTILNIDFVKQALLQRFVDGVNDFNRTLAADPAKHLCRLILKVKDFSQVKRNMSPDERKAYVADASVVYNTQAFKDIITEIQYDQLVFMGLQSENDRQLMIGRGTINGADLIESRMAQLDAEHQQNVKDSQPVAGSQTYEPISKQDIN